VRWWRAITLRGRLMLIGVTGIAAGLAVGGVMLLGALDLALQRAVDDGALQTASAVASLVDADRLPDPIPVSGSPTAAVQVIDEQGRVRAASATTDRLVALLRPDELRDARAGKRLFLGGERASVNGTLRVVAVKAGRDQAQTVVVAAPADQAQSSVRILRGVLLVGFPLLLIALAALAWRVIGLTLRPVEALRRGAEEITGAGAAGALPVPDARDEVHRLAVTLNDMLARLEGARQRQRAFVADAAHELRSPLASMRTQLEVAQRLGDRADWDATAQDLLIDTERLSRLVDDLLLLARADWAGGAGGSAGTGEPAAVAAGAGSSAGGAAGGAGGSAGGAVGRGRAAWQPVELSTLVDELLGRYGGARVVPTLAATGQVWTHGDPDALRRVVANLIDNAVRHATRRVVVEVHRAGGDAVVAVLDDGAGIPVEQRERVFDRFTRLDDARDRDSGGAGLGLAIVRELVRVHGGRVVLSDAEPGLRAEVRLAASPAPVDEPMVVETEPEIVAER
jgi:signal transduction histidine kinase